MTRLPWPCRTRADVKNKRGFICDMDGVIYHGSRLLEGSKGFVDWLKSEGKQFLFLTNSSARSPGSEPTGRLTDLHGP